MKAAVRTPADETAGGTIAGRADATLVHAGPRETELAAPTCGPQPAENAATTVSTPTATKTIISLCNCLSPVIHTQANSTHVPTTVQSAKQLQCIAAVAVIA